MIKRLPNGGLFIKEISVEELNKQKLSKSAKKIIKIGIYRCAKCCDSFDKICLSQIDNQKCVIFCDDSYTRFLTVDHNFPKSLGGNEGYNLQPMCNQCNHLKQNNIESNWSVREPVNINETYCKLKHVGTFPNGEMSARVLKICIWKLTPHVITDAGIFPMHQLNFIKCPQMQVKIIDNFWETVNDAGSNF